jgi:EAL domain-containing protein (putative c-di-GMP-specific phosphodiesterase class I)
LKIDRSFVKQIGTRDANSEIVRAIVALAHNLHMEVIAEGIETEEQMNYLKGMRCEYGQGFHFSGPVGAESAKGLISRLRRLE